MQFEQRNYIKTNQKTNQKSQKETINHYNISYQSHLKTYHLGLIFKNEFLNKAPQISDSFLLEKQSQEDLSFC